MTEHMRKVAAVLIAFAMSASATLQGDLSRSNGKVEQSATEHQNEAKNGTEEACGYVLEYPIKEQVARIGNSVVPIMAREIVSANCGYLKVWERAPNLRIHGTGQLAFV